MGGTAGYMHGTAGYMVVVGGGGQKHFSVSPRPLGFGFLGLGLWGLGPGLDNKTHLTFILDLGTKI